MMMRLELVEDEEVSSERSAISPKRRSSGVATLVAITSGLPPGRDACTKMVGKIHRGERGDRQHEIAGDADDGDAEGQKDGRHRPPDEEGGGVHEG